MKTASQFSQLKSNIVDGKIAIPVVLFDVPSVMNNFGSFKSLEFEEDVPRWCNEVETFLSDLSTSRVAHFSSDLRLCYLPGEDTRKERCCAKDNGRSFGLFEMYILSIYFSAKSLGSHFCFPIDAAD